MSGNGRFKEEWVGSWCSQNALTRAERGYGRSLRPEALVREVVTAPESGRRQQTRWSCRHRNEWVRRRITRAGARHRSDMTSRQDTTGRCQATLDQRDPSRCCNRCQDAGDAGDIKMTSLTSGRNACASDAGFIFADVPTSYISSQSSTDSLWRTLIAFLPWHSYQKAFNWWKRQKNMNIWPLHLPIYDSITYVHD